MQRIVRPAAASGVSVRLFLHAWDFGEGHTAVVDAAVRVYGSHLIGSRHTKPEARFVGFSSFIRSMWHVIDLAHRASGCSAGDDRFNQTSTLLMRHDIFWFSEPRPHHLDLQQGEIVTGTWCVTQPLHFGPKDDQGRLLQRCAPLVFCERVHSVHDYFLISQHAALWEYVTSLLSSLKEGAASGGHVMLDEHASSSRMRLATRQLWRSHPGAVSYIDYTLYRWTAFEVVEDRTSWHPQSYPAPRCHGQRVCIKDQNLSLIYWPRSDPGPFRRLQTVRS